MVDVGVDRLMQAAVTGCLPSGLGKRTADACLGRLSEVLQSNVFAFASPPAQSLATSVQQVVKSLSELKAPRLGEGNDPFLMSCMELYGYFVTAEATLTGKQKTVCGKGAAKEYLAKADGRNNGEGHNLQRRIGLHSIRILVGRVGEAACGRHHGGGDNGSHSCGRVFPEQLGIAHHDAPERNFERIGSQFT